MRRHVRGLSRILAGVVVPCAVIAACQANKVQLTFGQNGEGLDGFLCRDNTGAFVLDRVASLDGGTSSSLACFDGGAAQACLVVDFVRLGGLPDCRAGQLVSWCSSHTCGPIPANRVTVPVALPEIGGLTRANARQAVLCAVEQLSNVSVTKDAPNEFVLIRTIATAQSCDALGVQSDGTLPDFDETQLAGCAYSCPTLLSAVSGGLFLGFDTLTEQCEQGLRVCAANNLHWQAVSTPCGATDAG